MNQLLAFLYTALRGVAQNRVIGRKSAGTGRAELLDGADLRTIAGVYSTAEVDSALSGKQSTLVSGTNIKTVNSTSLLGSGDISTIGGSTGATANRVLTASGTGGSTLQASPVGIDGSGNVTGIASLSIGSASAVAAGFGLNRNASTGAILNSAIHAMQPTVTGSQAGFERYLGNGSVIGTLLVVPMGGANSGVGLGFSTSFANATPSLGIYPEANGFQINNGTLGTLRDLSCRAVIGGSGTIGVLRSSVNAGRGFGFSPVWGEPVITFDGTHVFAANTWAVTVGSSLSLMFSSSGSDLQGSYLTGLRPTSGQIEVRNAANTGSGNLLAANITASGATNFAPITKAALLLLTPNAATGGRWRVTDATPPNRAAYPTGTDWRYSSDDTVVT